MTSSSGSAPAGSIFHIALAADWAAAEQAGEYRISTIGSTLDEVGFIHASYAAQVTGTATRFYRGIAEPLVLLGLDPGRLGCEVRAEEAVPGGDVFPHIYGPIPVDAVVSATPLQRDADGG